MKALFAAALIVCTVGTAASAAAQAQKAHPCAADATAKAVPLLKLHFGVGPVEKVENFGVGKTVKVLPPIKALKGNGRFDVLEVQGYIYKAEYRMRFIYAQLRDSCLLMGQEILEASNPY
jgi:opacity protein-like surface antigen